MLMNQAMNLMEKLVDEIREASPEKRDHFMKMSLTLVAMGAEAMRTNPDFRRELAKVINQELQAYLDKS